MEVMIDLCNSLRELIYHQQLKSTSITLLVKVNINWSLYQLQLTSTDIRLSATVKMKETEEDMS